MNICIIVLGTSDGTMARLTFASYAKIEMITITDGEEAEMIYDRYV